MQEKVFTRDLRIAALLFDIPAYPYHGGWKKAEEDGAAESACIIYGCDENKKISERDKCGWNEGGKTYWFVLQLKTQSFGTPKFTLQAELEN